MRGCEGATVQVRPCDGACGTAGGCVGAEWGRRARGSAGFTQIELMNVMSIIVILAGIGLTLNGNSVTRAREAVLKEDLFRMRDAIDQYYADKNRYPPSLDAL